MPWYDVPPDQRKPPGIRCGDFKGRSGDVHRNRAGNPCGWRLGPGEIACPQHFGATPQAKRKAAERRQLMAMEQAVATYGLPVDIDPAQALSEEVNRTVGHVAWLSMEVAALERADIAESVLSKATTESGLAIERYGISMWVDLYQRERKHLVAVCRATLEAGVAERVTRLAEAQAEQLASVIEAILKDFGHDISDPAVRNVVRLRLAPAKAL